MIPLRIILHHSLTKDDLMTVSWGAIRRYHLNKGWRDIGYHAGIEMVRGQPEILLGRMWYQQGAHTLGQNEDTLGLCFLGNFDKEPPPPELWGLGLKIVRLWMKLFDIPMKKIYGHRDFSYKSCPGHLFNLYQFREDLIG